MLNKCRASTGLIRIRLRWSPSRLSELFGLRGGDGVGVSGHRVGGGDDLPAVWEWVVSEYRQWWPMHGRHDLTSTLTMCAYCHINLAFGLN